jgi:hypothetical protein
MPRRNRHRSRCPRAALNCLPRWSQRLSIARCYIEKILLDGFFSRTGISDMPSESRIGGLREFGLPYASDPVVSKTCWRPGTGAAKSVNCKVSSLISPSHEVPRSTGVTAPLARACASKRGGSVLLHWPGGAVCRPAGHARRH